MRAPCNACNVAKREAKGHAQSSVACLQPSGGLLEPPNSHKVDHCTICRDSYFSLNTSHSMAYSGVATFVRIEVVIPVAAEDGLAGKR